MEKPKFIKSDVFEPIANGMRSECIKVGQDGLSVIKLSKKTPLTAKGAFDLARNYKENYEKLVYYLGPYVIPTQFVVGEGSINPTIAAFQRYVEGVSLGEVVNDSRTSLTNGHLREFLSSCLVMYKETGVIPDVTGTPHIIGWWRPKNTPNVIVESVDGNQIPRLVDIGFISGEPPIMRTMHPRVLADSVANLLHIV